MLEAWKKKKNIFQEKTCVVHYIIKIETLTNLTLQCNICLSPYIVSWSKAVWSYLFFKTFPRSFEPNFYLTVNSPAIQRRHSWQILFAYWTHVPESDHSFSTYAKFSAKLTFLTPWYAYVSCQCSHFIPHENTRKPRVLSKTPIESSINNCPWSS